MPDKEPSETPPTSSPARENLELCLFIAAFALLLGVCTVGPLWMNRCLGTGAGLAASVAGFFIWVYAGPRPMPGLHSGILAFSGMFLIIGVGLGQLIGWLR